MFLSICCVTCVVFLLSSVSQTLFWGKNRSNTTSYPNGPQPWPLCGNLWTIYRLHRDPDKVLVELSQKYGAICMLWLGSWPCIVVSKAKVAHDLLHQVSGSVAQVTTFSHINAILSARSNFGVSPRAQQSAAVCCSRTASVDTCWR